MRLFLSCFAAISFFFISTLRGGLGEPVYEWTVHEAFISKNNVPLVLNAISEAPPQEMEEIKPAQPIDTIWIKGYWAWSAEHKDFLWVSGVSRIPPPGMTWNPGYWKHFEEGFVWIPGFWSLVPFDKMVAIDQPPPDPVAETPGFPESSNYFWNPGTWEYSPSERKYLWISGGWEILNTHWVLIPAQYEWRPQGYLYVPAFWDWPINKRGAAYLPVTIPKVSRKMPYRPEDVFEETQLYHLLIIYYPDYLSLCYHLFHFRPDVWASIAPAWWQWSSWWTLPWHDHWGLWWWYTHQSYPQPPGLTMEVIERIKSAHPRLLQMTKEMRKPFIVTAGGVVPPRAIVEAATQGRPLGKNALLLPASAKAEEKIKNEAEMIWRAQILTTDKEQDVEPSKRGKLHGIKESVSRPAIAKIIPRGVSSTERVPPVPLLSGDKAHIKESQQQKEIKGKNLEGELEEIPVNALKNARRPLREEKPAREKLVPPPDPSIIHPIPQGQRAVDRLSHAKFREGAKSPLG